MSTEASQSVSILSRLHDALSTSASSFNNNRITALLKELLSTLQNDLIKLDSGLEEIEVSLLSIVV